MQKVKECFLIWSGKLVGTCDTLAVTLNKLLQLGNVDYINKVLYR